MKFTEALEQIVKANHKENSEDSIEKAKQSEDISKEEKSKDEETNNVI